jgi:PAB-dependent poly(A)-specific ribonuclease subunit 3
MGVFPPPNFRAIHSLGAGDELWRHYRERSLAAARQMDPADPRHKAIPPPYCNAYCLDPPGSPSRSSFGYPSGTFQVTSRDDGHLYCLRRYDNCRAASSAAAGGKLAASVMDRWANPLSGGGAGAAVTDHPGIVPLVACFAAQRAFFFVHRLVPGAQTLRERLQAHVRGDHHHHPPHRRYPGGGPPEMLPEPLLWSCLSQLASALSAAHGVGLAVRSLDARHVLVTELPPPPPRSPNGTGAGAGIPRWRVRINCAGVLEALESETRRHAHEWQQLDLRALGRLVLGMAAAGRLGADPLDDDGRAQPGGLADAEAVLAQNYSRELHNLVVTLLRSGGQPQQHPGAAVPPPSPSIRDVVRALWPHTQAEADRAGRDLDRLESSLSAEYDAGRALRLLLKLGFVNGRPEFGPNRRWSQSGDCYVLSLFRDYGKTFPPAFLFPFPFA